MLVEFDLAQHFFHLEFKGHNATHHFVLVRLAQAVLLVGISRVVFANQVLEQAVLVVKSVDDFGLNRAMHHQIAPRRHPCQVGVDAWGHVRVRAHERHNSFGPCLQIAPVRVGLGAVAQQGDAIVFFKEMQWQWRDKRQAFIIIGDQ